MRKLRFEGYRDDTFGEYEVEVIGNIFDNADLLEV